MTTQVLAPLAVLDPTVAADAGPSVAAPRVSDLAGRTVGLLDNGKPNADRLLTHLARILVSRHGVKDTYMVRKSDSSTVAEADVLTDLIRHSHFVIAGIGD